MRQEFVLTGLLLIAAGAAISACAPESKSEAVEKNADDLGIVGNNFSALHLYRFKDKEAGVVCYVSTSGHGALSCIQLVEKGMPASRTDLVFSNVVDEERAQRVSK